MLLQVKVSAMLTEDFSQYRRDNHGWLFGWTDETVFQAGPSRQMNIFGTKGAGTSKQVRAAQETCFLAG